MLDLTKPVRTREESRVRLYNADTLDGSGAYPLHGAYEIDPGKWKNEAWTMAGKYSTYELSHRLDLENVPERKEFDLWVNVYQDEGVGACLSQETADLAPRYNLFARTKIHVSVEEGEGL